MKLIKKLVKFLLWIVGIVVVLVLALPLWIGPVVKTAANLVVPKKTGTAFNLGAFALNPYTGKLAVGDAQLFNPAGFDQKMAATVGSFSVEVDMASLAGDPVVVKDITLRDVFVSYVSNAKGKNNFAIIKQNATGEEVEEEGGRRKVEGRTKEDSTSSVQPPASNSQTSSSASKKVIIDRLRIENVMVQLGPIPLKMPNIDLQDIGRKSNGATMEEAWDQIYAQIMKNFNSLGVNIDELITNFANGDIEQTLRAIGGIKGGKDMEKALRFLDNIKGMEKALKAVDGAKEVKGMEDAFKGGAGEVSGAAGKTADAVGEATTKTMDAVGADTKKAVDAVGEQTDKAVNALKGLFK